MIGELIDRAVSVVSPAAAARRAHARSVYNTITQRNYEAARRDRLTGTSGTINRSADAEMLADADTIRARARDLVRNNAYARGILRAAVRNIVAHGICPQARVEFSNGNQNEKFNEAAERLWGKWQVRADVTGRLSFTEIQQLVVSERWEAGECLIRRVTDDSDRSRPIPLALQLIDADQLASDVRTMRFARSETGNEVRRGVEVDSFGRPVAYWLYTSHPNDVGGRMPEAKRYPADEFIHLFRPLRIGQTRGISEFTTVARWAKGIHRYVDYEMDSKSVASCFSVAIKTLDGAASGGFSPPAGADTADDNGNAFEHVEPGLVARLMPGEEVQVIDPGRSESESASWINLMLRSLGVGTGLSYERLTRDYSQTNYSSNRAGDLEDRREFRMEQQWLVDHLCRPVWEWFIAAAVEKGIDGFPDAAGLVANYDRYTSHIWQTPGWEWVDPEKEANASIAAIDANLSTLADEIGKRGGDWRDTIKQRAREQEFIADVMPQPETSEEQNAEQATADAAA